MRSICWLRRDLRLSDNTALHQSCMASQEVILLFIFDENILDKIENKHDKRVDFIQKSIFSLREKVKEFGSDLIIRFGKPQDILPQIAAELHADAVFTNYDYESYAKKRDKEVETNLAKIGVNFYSFKDQVIYDRGDVKNLSNEPFKVFTPYKKAWLKKFESDLLLNHTFPVFDYEPIFNKLIPQNKLLSHISDFTIYQKGFFNTNLEIPTGEQGADLQFENFKKDISNYKLNRDIPAINGTSRLSVHLRFGTISIRKLVAFAYSIKNDGAATWLSELIWREFYMMILDNFPNTMNESFKHEYKNIPWKFDEQYWLAWCNGNTGYPIVDAAMRHFNKTGWMHNRLRMIVASFLTKDLLIDWRLGERYFAERLLDYDAAANIGGWQWCASTGCDSQPYFRIFNPVLQSMKFDTDGTFIKANCPELKGFSGKLIHFPSEATMFEQHAANCIVGENYPLPIVNHDEQRKKALEMYKSNI